MDRIRALADLTDAQLATEEAMQQAPQKELPARTISALDPRNDIPAVLAAPRPVPAARPQYAVVAFGEERYAVTAEDVDGALVAIETSRFVAVIAVSEPSPSPARDASEAVTELYKDHYNQLVRMAVLLVHDVQTAEEIVQDAFEAMHLAWRRLRNREKALSYLRQTIVNKSRSVLRHRIVVETHAPSEHSAEHAALTLIERSAVITALRSLPARQREAIVLRYYADLSEADIARAMGISRGAVKSHTARAMTALRSILEQEA
jgi:RNA polymerase sigma-70 factor (sigma-E family)